MPLLRCEGIAVPRGVERSGGVSTIAMQIVATFTGKGTRSRTAFDKNQRFLGYADRLLVRNLESSKNSGLQRLWIYIAFSHQPNDWL